MLSLLSNTRVYLAAGQTDLRNPFDPLAGVLCSSLPLVPLARGLQRQTFGARLGG
jgi:hypothetical protein